MNTYFIRTIDGNSGKITADGYSIIGGLVNLWTKDGYVAVFNVTHLVSICLMKSEKNDGFKEQG